MTIKKPDFLANDSLSRRIFQNDGPELTIRPITSLFSLRAELKTLRDENEILQQTLRLSSGLRQRFEELYDDSPVGLLTLDVDDRIIEANLTFAQLLGIKRSDLIGQHVGRMIAPEDHATFIRHLTQLREHTSCSPASERCALRIINTDSEHIETRLESSLVPANYLTEPPLIRINVYHLTNGTDPQSQCHTNLRLANLQLQKEINERKLAEDKTRHHQEQLAHVARLNTVGEMASGLAHEINQPLAAITSYAQSCLRLMKGSASKQAQLPDILGQINTQSQRAANIVKHLRNFVTKGKPHRETAELAKIVQLAVSMVRNEIISNQIELDISAQPMLPPIEADTIQIEQVILNLLRNAAEAMSDVAADSRRLLITLGAHSETHLFVAIRDTGPGIHDDDSVKISTPFFSTKENGMGLGLAISRTIVEDHGGQLTHKTNSDGGATFTFTLAFNGKFKTQSPSPSPRIFP